MTKLRTLEITSIEGETTSSVLDNRMSIVEIYGLLQRECKPKDRVTITSISTPDAGAKTTSITWPVSMRVIKQAFSPNPPGLRQVELMARYSILPPVRAALLLFGLFYTKKGLKNADRNVHQRNS